jgi:PleD family two-component response regulator
MAAPNKKSNNNKEKNTSYHYSNNPRKILIVDDKPDITSAFDMILEMNGFIVYVFNEPLSALSNYRAGLYDL